MQKHSGCERQLLVITKYLAYSPHSSLEFYTDMNPYNCLVLVTPYLSAKGEAQIETQGAVPSQAAGRPLVSAPDPCLCPENPYRGDGPGQEQYIYFFADRNIKKEVMEQIEKLNCNKLLRPDGIHQRVVEE